MRQIARTPPTPTSQDESLFASIYRSTLEAIQRTSRRYLPEEIVHYKTPDIWERFNQPGTLSTCCRVDETERRAWSRSLPALLAKVAKDSGARLVECHIHRQPDVVELDEIRSRVRNCDLVLTSAFKVDTPSRKRKESLKRYEFAISPASEGFIRSGGRLSFVTTPCERAKVEKLHAFIVAHAVSGPSFERDRALKWLRQMSKAIKTEAAALKVTVRNVKLSKPAAFFDDEPYGHGD